MEWNGQTLYFNGNILTVDENFTIAEAVLTGGGRILAVGKLADVEAQALAGAKRHNLAGRTMIPGFVDPHGHFPDSGFLALFRVDVAPPPIGNCDSLEKLFERLAERVRKTPPGDWIIAARFDPAGFSGARYPTRDELDRVSTRHPIWLSHFTGHAGVANSLALAFRGVDESSADPAGGMLGRIHESGRLDGLLTGMAAMGALGDTEFMMNLERFHAAVKLASEEYLSEGVTFAQNAWAPETLLKYFCDLATKPDDGRVGVMVLPAGFLEPQFTNGELGFTDPASQSVIFGPRKLFADGSIHIQTACLTKPYHRPLNGDPSYCCKPSITVEDMCKRMLPLHNAGFQLHIHANGDATADIVLEAMARVLEHTPRDDHRHTLIHAQTLRADQLDRLAELGMSVSFFIAHVHYWGEYHHDVSLGPERAANISPAGWAAERGLRYTIHNDTTVTPMLPLHLMWCAVQRMTTAGRVLGPHQRISAREALKAHTIDAAWQVFQESERGSIEVGKRADFSILSSDPLGSDDAIRDISVLETILGGRVVYKRAQGA